MIRRVIKKINYLHIDVPETKEYTTITGGRYVVYQWLGTLGLTYGDKILYEGDEYIYLGVGKDYYGHGKSCVWFLVDVYKQTIGLLEKEEILTNTTTIPGEYHGSAIQVEL